MSLFVPRVRICGNLEFLNHLKALFSRNRI